MTSQNIEVEYDFSTGHAQPVTDLHLHRTPQDLAGLSTHEFITHMAATNEAFAAAEANHRAAQQALAVMLTEQVARHLIATRPTAALLFVRTGADFHQVNGQRDPGCEGHEHRLVPFEIADTDGNTLDPIDVLSPLHYLLERLTPLLGLEDQVLDLADREWMFDCTHA